MNRMARWESGPPTVAQTMPKLVPAAAAQLPKVCLSDRPDTGWGPVDSVQVPYIAMA